MEEVMLIRGSEKNRGRWILERDAGDKWIHWNDLVLLQSLERLPSNRHRQKIEFVIFGTPTPNPLPETEEAIAANQRNADFVVSEKMLGLSQLRDEMGPYSKARNQLDPEGKNILLSDPTL
jgi:hypothetical protein